MQRYTILRRGPLVMCHTYYDFVSWFLQQPQVGGQIIITGVDAARAPDVIRTASVSTTAVIPSAPPQFKVPTRKGIMLNSAHADFIQWLAENCPPKQNSIATAAGKKRTDTAARLSAPIKKTGPLLPRHFRAFVAAAAKKYQLDIRIDQFESAREVSGHGIFLKRRRPPVPVPMNLILQIQQRTAEVYYCAPFFDSGSMWTVFTTVQHFVNGDKEFVQTQPDIGPHIYNPDSSSYFSCPATDNTDDVDPFFDYGASTGDPDTISYSGSVSPSGLLATALSNLAAIHVTGVTATASTDVLTKTAHGLTTGALTEIDFTSGFGGLTSGNSYYVIRLDADTFKLATTHANALATTAINITSDGTSGILTPITDALDLSWMSDGSPPSYSDVQLGSWTDNAAPYTTRAATSYRYRWISTGPGMHLEWTQGGVDKTLDLPADTTSSWYDDTIAGLPMGDYDFITDLVISF